MPSGRLCGTRRVFSALFGLSWLAHSVRIVSLLPSSDRKPVWLVPVHSSFHAMSTSLIIFRPCELLGVDTDLEPDHDQNANRYYTLVQSRSLSWDGLSQGRGTRRCL